MAHILVVDYSRSGNTRKLAHAIAGALGADLEDLQDLRPRHGILGWLRSGREGWRGVAGEIAPTLRKPADYDLVILGSPVWAGRVSAPMRGYLLRHAGQFGRIAAFVTMGGSGGAKALADMAQLAGSTPIATLELTERQLAAGAEAKLGAFVKQVQAAI